MNEHIIHQVSDISIHATIMVIFLTCFFFIVSVRIEKHVAEEQITKISKIYTEKSFIKTAFNELLDDKKKNELISSIESGESDTTIETTNKQIMINGFTFTGIIVIICIILNLVLYNISKELNILNIIYSNLITISFIAVIEFIFIFFIGKNIDIIKASDLNNKLFDIIGNYI